jgi:hypothetical protein
MLPLIGSLAGAEGAAAGAEASGGLGWGSLKPAKPNGIVNPKGNGTRGRSVLDWKSLLPGM